MASEIGMRRGAGARRPRLASKSVRQRRYRMAASPLGNLPRVSAGTGRPMRSSTVVPRLLRSSRGKAAVPGADAAGPAEHPAIRISRATAGFQGRSAAARREMLRRATSPAGNTTSAPPPRSHSTLRRKGVRFSSVAARPPNGLTRMNRSRISGIAASIELAMSFTSGRTRPRTPASTAASSMPNGWLARMASGPAAGMRARSAGST